MLLRIFERALGFANRGRARHSEGAADGGGLRKRVRI
jgi:hypothetical protein